jgi:hypothetical protein
MSVGLEIGQTAESLGKSGAYLLGTVQVNWGRFRQLHALGPLKNLNCRLNGAWDPGALFLIQGATAKSF